MKNSLVSFILKHNFKIVSFLCLFIFLTFVNDHDINGLLKLYGEQGQLEEQLELYKQKVAVVEKQRNAVLSNDQNLEKFARERYYMKKKNEEIFVVVDEFGRVIEE
jgi:cell division protein DivIC